MTSDRLDEHDVANRWFPKVRSWFALGAPLELLSPLSVARIVALVAVVTWPLSAAVADTDRVVTVTLTALSVGTVWWLLRQRALALRHVAPFLLACSAAVMVALVASSGEHRSLPPTVFVSVMALMAGLFLRPRVLFSGMAAGALALPAVVRVTHGGVGVSDAFVTVLFASLLGAMTAMTVRTSRLAGLVDPDTGVPNTRGLAERLRRRDRGTDTVVAVVHLRGVGQVRDALGHHAGIELVRRAVEDLGQVLPSSATIGRGAEDDVVVIISNVADRATATTDLVALIVRRVEAAIGTGRYLVGDIEVTLNTHVGIAVAARQTAPFDDENAPDDPVELLRRAGLAARTARDRGHLVEAWDGQSTALTVDDLDLLGDLRMAAERGELRLAFQPQVRTPDGRIVAVEALLRWENERHGFVSPGRFIPLAERTGLVDRLTDWVLDEALDAQARWVAGGFDITVSVNVSPLSLRSVEFGSRVLAALAERDLDPGRLMLEVTESAAFDIPEAVERLAPLRERGVKISIDDFGTGYTSLAVLPHLPLDELKVDQQFVREVRNSPASEAIVRSVCELAHRLQLTAVAEGVEDEELAMLMTTYGFDLLQGYHFAKPMWEHEVVERLEAQDRPLRPEPHSSVRPAKASFPSVELDLA